MAIFVFFLITILMTPLIHPTMAGARTDLLAKICGNSKVQVESEYMRSYAKILQTMQGKMQKKKFATGEDGENPNRIYVLSQCMDDLSGDDCDACFSKISTRLYSCFPFTAGRVFLDGCFMRFDNYNFYQETTSNDVDTQRCSNVHGASKQYTESAKRLIDDMAARAPRNKGYAEAEMKLNDWLSLYGMATCWKSLDSKSCAHCLATASAAAAHCLPSEDGRALNTGCFLRYSNLAFSNKKRNSFPNPDAFITYAVYVLGVGTCLLAVFLIGIFLGKVIYKKRRNHQHQSQGLEVESLVTISLRFKFSTLQKATEDFSESHKIGQGGYGEVFKGALPDGREIAIKRLFLSGKDQVQAVCHEIDIICLAQHKNLVRFLGCSFANDSLLVYEYLANGSLDRVLFDPEKKKELDWKRRLGIIKGTAEGLAYLHKDCQVRIIHRDITAGNILLDWKYRPKISDFGLARFYSTDKMVTNTAITGTLGYMAPEYLIEGRLSDKVDVYSYGVLVLEIISGVQNNKYHSDDTLRTLVTTTWKHFQGNTMAEIIDKDMEIEDANEVMRVVQIGLLCTQESPSLRPPMTSVVEMLGQKNLELPTPTKPPFADEFLTMPDSSIDSSSSSSSSLRRHHQHAISIDSSNYHDFHDDLR